MPIISAFGKLKQDHQIWPSLGYIAGLGFKNKNKTTTKMNHAHCSVWEENAGVSWKKGSLQQS
jgi:hypothetical protein